MKPIRFFSILAVLVVLIIVGCSKENNDPVLAGPVSTDTTTVTDTTTTELTLMDSLAGSYLGYRYYKGEFIDCPGNQLPCNFTYEYDTLIVEVQVINAGDTALQIIDMEDGYIDRTIPLIDLEYSGYPIHDAPEGHYDLHFSQAPHDSLIIRTLEGGGAVWQGGGTYYFYSYDLLKQ